MNLKNQKEAISLQRHFNFLRSKDSQVTIDAHDGGRTVTVYFPGGFKTRTEAEEHAKLFYCFVLNMIRSEYQIMSAQFFVPSAGKLFYSTDSKHLTWWFEGRSVCYSDRLHRWLELNRVILPATVDDMEEWFDFSEGSNGVHYWCSLPRAPYVTEWEDGYEYALILPLHYLLTITVAKK